MFEIQIPNESNPRLDRLAKEVGAELPLPPLEALPELSTFARFWRALKMKMGQAFKRPVPSVTAD